MCCRLFLSLWQKSLSRWGILAFFVRNRPQAVKKIPTDDLNGFHLADIKGIRGLTLPLKEYRQRQAGSLAVFTFYIWQECGQDA
jgi:hypothetical protein